MATLVQHAARLCQWTGNALLPVETPEEPYHISDSENIAIVVPFFIGDTILSSVFLQNIQKAVPEDVPIHVIGPPPHLNVLETLLPEGRTFPMPNTISERKDLLQQLGCDTVFLLRFSLPWAYTIRSSDIPHRIGLNLERFGLDKLQTWGHLLSMSLPSSRFDTPTHQVTLYQQMLEQLGVLPAPATQPRINLVEDDYLAVEPYLIEQQPPRIVLHMSAGSPGKRWPLAYWVTLVESLNQAYHASFIALGAGPDIPLYDQLASETGIPILNLCGKTTIRQSAVLCQRSDLVVTLDTAVAHIAAAAGAPRLVVLYGPTNVQQWQPVVSDNTQLEQVYLPMSCRPCITRTCYHRGCLQWLTPDRVLTRIHTIWPEPENNQVSAPVVPAQESIIKRRSQTEPYSSLIYNVF